MNKKILSTTSRKLRKLFINLSLIFISFFSLINFSYAQIDTNIPPQLAPNAAGVDGDTSPIVTCGNAGQKPCTIDDLVGLANNFGHYVLVIVFPAVFFIGLGFVIYPLLVDPNNPNNLTKAKSRGWKLLAGSGFMLGAYLLVRAVLSSIGVKESPIFKKVISVKDLFFDKAYAQAATANTNTFSNPLESLSIQNIIYGIVNLISFFAIIGIILGIIRGVILLMMSQENPEYLKKGKKWILYSLLVAVIVFGAEMIYNIISNTVTSVFE